MSNSELETEPPEIPSTLPEDIPTIAHDENIEFSLSKNSEQTSSIQSQINTMMELVEKITYSVEQLQADFETKIRYDESKERIITTLHRELQDYRDDLVLKHLRPIVNDLIKMHDDIGRTVSNYSVENGNDLVTYVQDFRLDIEEILARNGIEVYVVSGDLFDSVRQRVHKIIAIDNPELDKHIAERLRVGFNYGERIIRHEIINIYQHKVSNPS